MKVTEYLVNIYIYGKKNNFKSSPSEYKKTACFAG